MSVDLFALERLRQNPDMGFEELREAADLEGLPLLPIHYGRARRQLGLTAGATATRAAPELANSAVDDIATDTSAEQPAATPRTATRPGLKRPSTPAFEFLVEQLRSQPTISYGELRRLADDLNLKIAPIMYGRAKALLGLVPVRPRGQGKSRKQAPTAGLGQVRADSPEQFAQQLEAVQSLEDLRAIARHLELQRRRLRTALEQIATQVDEAIR